VNILSHVLETFDKLLNKRQILRLGAILAQAEATEDLEYRFAPSGCQGQPSGPVPLRGGWHDFSLPSHVQYASSTDFGAFAGEIFWVRSVCLTHGRCGRVHSG